MLLCFSWAPEPCTGPAGGAAWDLSKPWKAMGLTWTLGIRWSCISFVPDFHTGGYICLPSHHVPFPSLQLYSTPLHVATRTGHTAIVEYLLSCGAKVNSRDRVGRVLEVSITSRLYLFYYCNLSEILYLSAVRRETQPCMMPCALTDTRLWSCSYVQALTWK